MIRTLLGGGGGLLALTLVACVTINVYFPAAAVEQAADRIIEDVWGQRPAPESPPQSRTPQPPEPPVVEMIARAFLILIPPAQAQQADINVSTPAIEQLKQSLSNRFNQLKSHYDSGAVGLTGDGLVAVRNLDAVPLNQRNQVQQLVQQENQDRQALYREIARANDHPDWEDQIREVFAQRWIGNARSGWWYQSGGSWRQK
jgi:uncharacterized protein